MTVTRATHRIQRPPVGRWLLTPSFWALLILSAIVTALGLTGHGWWAAPFALPLGIACARWLVRVAAYCLPFRFRSEWLRSQGWTTVPRDS